MQTVGKCGCKQAYKDLLVYLVSQMSYLPCCCEGPMATHVLDYSKIRVKEKMHVRDQWNSESFQGKNTLVRQALHQDLIDEVV